MVLLLFLITSLKKVLDVETSMALQGYLRQ